MPPLVAAAAVAAGGAIVGAKMQSGAAKSAAQIQSDAATKAAQLQADANEKTLAFQKEQAAADLARANAVQQGNYNQWASREGRLSDFGQALGLSARNIPAYVPLTANGQTPQTNSQGAAQAWTPDFIKQQLQATGQDPSDQNVQYWLGKEGELKAREQQLNQPGYALWRLRDPNSGGRGASMPAGYMNSFAGALAPPQQNPLVYTPALQRPNSFGQMVA